MATAHENNRGRWIHAQDNSTVVSDPHVFVRLSARGACCREFSTPQRIRPSGERPTRHTNLRRPDGGVARAPFSAAHEPQFCRLCHRGLVSKRPRVRRSPRLRPAAARHPRLQPRPTIYNPGHSTTTRDSVGSSGRDRVGRTINAFHCGPHGDRTWSVGAVGHW